MNELICKEIDASLEKLGLSFYGYLKQQGYSVKDSMRLNQYLLRTRKNPDGMPTPEALNLFKGLLSEETLSLVAWRVLRINENIGPDQLAILKPMIKKSEAVKGIKRKETLAIVARA